MQLRSKDGSIAKIKTPDAETWHSLLVSPKKKTKSDSNEDDPQYASTNTHVLNWIPEQLVQVMEETDDNSVKDVVLSVDQELTQSFSENIRPHSGITDNNSETKYDESVEEQNDVHQASSSTDASTSYDIVEVIENDLHQIIGACPARIDLIHMLNGVKDLSVLTHKVLDIITAALIRERKSSEVLRKSWKKDKKIDLIRHVYNQARDPLVASKRKKNPPRLSSLCEQIIKSQKMPKSILNVVYATYIYDIEYQAWVSKLPQVPLPRLKEGNRDPLVQFWYSFPEQICDQFIGKGTNCSHNLTHLRVRSCTTCIAEVSNKAWISAAKSNETCLNSALAEDLIDKQSVPNARTNFCEEVEDWMAANGYKDASELTNLIRCWYDACDSPGISAEVRVESLLRMRNFLLRGVDFGKFPPPSRYINKIPVVSFEGILIDIDTKIQLHSLTGPYNIKSVGSLAAETTVGILQQLNPNSSVSIKARDVPALVSSVVELMTCRLNNER